MYTWNDSLEDWARPGRYRFDSARAAERAVEARAAAAAGPRTFSHDGPDEALVTPRKHVITQSKTPLVIAVDVTGSMADWPAEIFDRLPLLYNTLSQYRPELDICFAAIGDAGYDRWPLQVTRFCRGFSLETQLKAIYGEGGGGDEPESYELFAHWINTHVTLAGSMQEKPFMIVFGDAPMHPKVLRQQVKSVMGDALQQDLDAIEAWQQLARTWNVLFLRRKGIRRDDATGRQWEKALGAQHILTVFDEQRAVDYAMGLIARAWGHLDDFSANMAARQSDSKVTALLSQLRTA
jgi:hypothetical protein